MPNPGPDPFDRLDPHQFAAHVIAAHPEFAIAWTGLADHGVCDALGGPESRRVYGEWVAAGCPMTATRFIAGRVDEGVDR